MRKSGILRELGYSRRGGLTERFKVWIGLLELVENEISTLSVQEYLVLDPDSRLTQLGVLPLAPLAATASLIAEENRVIPLKLLFPNSPISG